MSWANRIKLLLGLVVVVVVVGVCTVIFTQRQAEVTSNSAEIEADTYVVGTDYGGTVTEQLVRAGDTVSVGEALLEIRSLSLLQDIRRNPVTFDTSSYAIATDGTITFKATVAGTISSVTTKAGDFVQAGADLVTIDKADSLFVTGEYVLTPRDYERVSEGAQVDLMLPDQSILAGTVRQITVRTVDGQAQTSVTVESPGLVQGASNGLVTPGTPVSAVLHLRQDDVLAGARDATGEFLRSIGI